MWLIYTAAYFHCIASIVPIDNWFTNKSPQLTDIAECVASRQISKTDIAAVSEKHHPMSFNFLPI